MEITIKAEAKEIADLVLAIQNRQKESFELKQGLSRSNLDKPITNPLSKN